MQRQNPLTCAVAALLISWAAPARGVDLHNVLVDYTVTSWSAKDGLPAGAIWSLAQDRDGYLWIGGDFGLLRFDGVRFASWEALGRSPLPRGPVQLLCLTHDGSLWVGFGDRGGVNRIRDDQISSYRETEGLPRGAISALLEDRKGTIWAATGSGVYRFINDRWQKWETSDNVSGHQILTAAIGPSGHLLVVADTGVFEHVEGHDTFQQLEEPRSGDAVHSITEDMFGRRWITDRIVGFRQVGEPQPSASQTESGKGYRLLSDRRGNLWVATFGQGLWRVRVGAKRQATIERATDLTGLSNNVIYSLLEDREGNIWAGTTDGLNRLTPHKLTQIRDLGLVTGLEVTADGSVWAGTAEGLKQLSPTNGTWQDRQQLRGVRLDAMRADAQGALWVATRGSLLRFDSGSQAPAVLSDRLRQVKSITSDGQGGAWLYDVDRGLLRWSRGHIETVALPSELQHARATESFTDRHGKLWIAFTNGRVAVQDGNGGFHVYGRQDGLNVGNCRAIYEDRDGMVWFGGAQGLARFADGHFAMLPHAAGFPTESVTGIIDDDVGGLWFGTASGIVRVRRSDFAEAVNGHWDHVHYNLYDNSDGIAGTTGWNGQRSAVRTPDGRLWFLTAQGVTIVNPRTLQDSAASAPIRIDGVVVNDRKLTPTSAMSLGPGATRLEIDYTVLNLTSPRRTRFRYRLEGLDPNWIDAGIARQAIYTNLAPGTYRFRVEANDERGAWTGPAAAWDFSVRPAFYQTTWFLAAAVAALGLGAWSAWRLRLQQVHRRFSLLLGERVRLSREIHDTLLQSLVGIALQLDILEHDLEESPPSSRSRFVQMRKQLEEYIREARQSIWNLRSSALEQHGLVSALRQYGERAGEHGIALRFSVTGTPFKCEPQVEEQILRIGQEAILNSIRHAGAHEIQVDLEYGDGRVKLRVADDGRGFDPVRTEETAAGHWGVLTMRERAETVGGEFRVSSHDGRGTEIETVVPARVN